MTEKEFLHKIRESADSIEIPESLEPKQIKEQLDAKNNLKTAKQSATEPNKFSRKSRPHIYSMQRTASAAAVLLLCATLSAVAWNIRPDSASPTTTDSSDPTLTTDTKLAADQQTDPANNPGTNNALSQAKKDAGSLYTIAKSYDEIYDTINSSYQEEYRTYTTEDVATIEGLASTEESKSSNYSTTNLQTQGVDESDRVKTDGRYIYTVTGSKILITDVKEGHLTPISSICPKLGATDSILEIYVDDNKLLLLVQHYETSMEISTSITDTEEETSYLLGEENTKSQTILYTYDVTDPANPLLTGTTTQDGNYKTSRKIGDMVYLFTNQFLGNETLSGNEKKIPLPCINGESISYLNTYLPDQGSQGLILSSINLKKPDEIVDKVMIIHNFVNIYVGADSIYLYETNYSNEDILTEIAGFSMKNGIFDAINAVSVKGEILDTFAINETDQSLRVLTTSYDVSGQSSNNLYLFDKNMELTGSLTDIAKGEQIYAARYFNDTAYFITYRNIDPLFAVDISDPSSPKLLGELEITGFSEYLHFWGEDKLLGIGYETDQNTNKTKGIKLVMFDISNPVELKVIDTLVLDNYIYSPALYNYKCVLADANENLIGFVGESEKDSYEYTYDYLLFSWENDHFSKKMAASLSNHNYIAWDYLRGMYIDDIFYIADFNLIMSFDRKNEYQTIEELTLASTDSRWICTE